MRHVSEKTKIKEKRGTGEGENYIPWIRVSEARSIGTSTIAIDYKHGRQVHLLSRGEKYYYHLNRWRDEVKDIREQFPLDIGITQKIADKYGIMHPANKGEIIHMTTDLVITLEDGTLEALSVKSERSVLDNPRTSEKLKIEKTYWLLNGVPFKILFTDDVNITEVRNIIDVTRCYSNKKIWDEVSLLRHLLARKMINVDMTKPLEYRKLIQELEDKENEIWKTQKRVWQEKF